MEIVSPGGALKNIYENLEKYCSKGCGTITKLKDAFRHEIMCSKPNCVNFSKCGKKADAVINGYNCCSEKCAVFQMLKDGVPLQPGELSLLLTGLSQRLVFNSKDIHTYCYWDMENKGNDILLSNDLKMARHTGSAKKFSTVVSKVGLTKSAHLVELQISTKPDKPVKIGLVSNLDFDRNQAFSDFPTGYAFYTLGQLRCSDHGKGRHS